MFHYVLDGATIRPLVPPSDLPSDQVALQMPQLMAQGLLAAGGALPPLMPGSEAAAGHEVPAHQEQLLAEAAAHEQHQAAPEAAEQRESEQQQAREAQQQEAQQEPQPQQERADDSAAQAPDPLAG